LKVRPEEKLYLKASVLKRNKSIVVTPDPSLLIIRLGLFVKGLAKGNLGGTSIFTRTLDTREHMKTY